MIFLALAAQIVSTQDFPEREMRPTLEAQRASVRESCASPVDSDRSALLADETGAARAADRHNAKPAQLVALACTRIRLALDGAIAHEGLFMVSGSSWVEGAVRAALAALAIDSSDIRAARVVAALAVSQPDLEPTKEIERRIEAASLAPDAPPAVLRACTELAVRANDSPGAHRCADLALKIGRDSTWHLLRLATLAFRSHDSVAGEVMFRRAAVAAHDSLSRAQIDWQVQWFLSPVERSSWATLPDSMRGSWLVNVLHARDVRDGQPEHARLAAHFARLDYVEKTFRLAVPARFRAALLTGPAAEESGKTPPSDVDGMLARGVAEPGGVPARMWRNYNRWQIDFDDRGIVWMRYGPPTRRIRWSCPGSLPPCPTTHNVREAWQYTIDGRSMVLNFEGEGFDGSVEATRLVSGVLGSYICDLDARRCGLNELAKSGKVTVEEIEALRRDDQASILLATTTDDNSPRGDADLHLAARFARLWDPESGAPFALATYAVPAHDLSIEEEGAKRSTSFSLELRQWNDRLEQWLDTTAVVHQAVKVSGPGAPSVIGYLTLPTSLGVSSWSLVATQPSRRGRTYAEVPAIGTSGPALSDLVVGSGPQGLTWHFHGTAVPLAPQYKIDRSAPMALFYQVRSDTSRADLRIVVAIFRSENGVAQSAPALTISAGRAIRTGINDISSTVNLARLDSGAYRLDVSILDSNGATLSRRSTWLNLD